MAGVRTFGHRVVISVSSASASASTAPELELELDPSSLLRFPDEGVSRLGVIWAVKSAKTGTGRGGAGGRGEEAEEAKASRICLMAWTSFGSTVSVSRINRRSMP